MIKSPAMEESKNRYLLMQDVAELAIKCGGTVYGGYVRDFIAHDYAAKKFFDTHTLEEYNDKTVSPETSDRFLVAKDIDIHFKKQVDYSFFRRELRRKNFHTTVTRVENLYIMGGSTRHFALNVEFRIRTIPRILSGVDGNTRKVLKGIIGELQDITVPGGTFKMDVVVDPTNEPPFRSTLDYECNGLIMNSNGITLGAALTDGLNHLGKYRVLERVIENIKAKKAVTISPSRLRWEKMAARDDWEIEGGLVHKNIASGEDCVICTESIPSGGVFKLGCCNARYHLGCISTTITRHIADKQTCPHCRNETVLSPQEMAVYSANIENF